MKTNALDKCVNILSFQQDDDPKKIEVLSGMDTNLHEEFVESFRRELGLNLLTKSTFQEKKDLIMFYIDELDRVIVIPKKFEDIEPVRLDIDELYYPIWYKGQDVSDDLGISEVRAHYLFSLLFVVIQDYCILYNITFIEICNDRFLILETIDLSPIRDREELTGITKPTTKQREPAMPVIKPIFVNESISEIYEILRDFFSPEDQIEFYALLNGGENAPKPLLFLGSGNRLADAFKQLYDCDIIRGCQKKELEYWISINFSYRYRNKLKTYTLPYLSEIMSTRKDMCQKPVLNIILEKATGTYLISKI